MNEATAYQWAWACITPVQAHAPSHRLESLVDLIASAILESYGNGQQSLNTPWQEGQSAGQEDEALNTMRTCPYPTGSVEAQWWTRGYASSARALRAIKAEQALATLLRNVNQQAYSVSPGCSIIQVEAHASTASRAEEEPMTP